MSNVWRLAAVAIALIGFFAVAPASPVQADGVVGDGTPGSCDEIALDTALAGGGSVTFNCHLDDLPIVVTSEKVIVDDTQIDGGGVVTLSGGDTARIFVVTTGTTLELDNITLIDGNSNLGGAIFNAGSVTLTGSTLSDNMAANFGGAIFNSGGTITLTNSTLSGNSAINFGGGISNNGGTVTLTNSTLSGNSADSGGGIDNFGDGGVTLTNSTLSDNSAVIGGGIFNEVGDVTLTNSTVSSNSASSAGGGIRNIGSALLQNTIIANNGAPSGSSNCNGNSVSSQGGNLSDDESCALGGPGDLNNVEDGLGPLDDNGGPTQTHLPQTGSNAIDNALSANCPAEDQRGISRPQGLGCDIGSVEVRQGATYPLCVSPYTGAVTSPLSGCGAGQVEVDVPDELSFCIDSYTGRVLYLSGQPCQPPRWTHTMPDDGDLLTCVNVYTGANHWVADHSQCNGNEVANTIPATP